MKTACNICSDHFEESINIMAGSCGHTFHEVCLQTWLKESRSCPTCRKYLTAKNTIRLYLHFMEDDDPNCSVTSNPNLHLSELQNQRRELQRLGLENAQLRADNKELTERLTTMEATSEEWRQKYFEAVGQRDIIKKQIKDLGKQLKDVERLREECSSLRRRMEDMKNVNLVLNGTKKDVEDMLRDVKMCPESFHSFAVHISVLKQQVNAVSESRASLLKAQKEIRGELLQAEADIKRLKKELENKVSYIWALEKQVASSPSIPSSEKSPHPTQNISQPSEIDVTPLSMRTTKKLKVNQISCLQDQTNRRLPSQRPTSSWLGQPQRLWTSKSLEQQPRPDPDSAIREGYNGLGGHSTFVSRSTTFSFPGPKKSAKR